MSPADLAERERQIASVRQTLGAKAFADAWRAGRAMSLEQAVEYALTAPPARRVPASESAGPSIEQAASPLSARELEVSLLLARGFTNRQVAEELVISKRTASTHVTHILTKLGFSTRSQVAAWAVERGLAG
ncbi:MAG TPA: LuxR C-terminal-related transcriptional regulator [Chloroflexota bacterium]|nr:LuxR C-terminal-related transcriptional regulator [Chloroflexota bacterium]